MNRSNIPIKNKVKVQFLKKNKNKVKVQNNLFLNATKFSDYIKILCAYLHKIKNSQYLSIPKKEVMRGPDEGLMTPLSIFGP